MNLNQWFVVFFVSAIHFFAFSHCMDVVPFFVEMKEVYQVGYAEIGGLVSAFLLGYALFQIPAGVLADRYSPKKVVLAGLAAMMVSSLLLVMTKSFLVALAMRFIMGASSALLFSPGIKLISEFVLKERRGLSVGMMEGAAGMGMLLTLTIFPLLSVYWPWRYLFLALSLFMLPLLLLFWKLPSEAEMENRERDDPPIPDGRGGKGNAAARWFEPVRNARVLRLLGIAFFGFFWPLCLSGLVAHLSDGRNGVFETGGRLDHGAGDDQPGDHGAGIRQSFRLDGAAKVDAGDRNRRIGLMYGLVVRTAGFGDTSKRALDRDGHFLVDGPHAHLGHGSGPCANDRICDQPDEYLGTNRLGHFRILLRFAVRQER
nr:MFS transporter [Caldalkalibacillus thermarum]